MSQSLAADRRPVGPGSLLWRYAGDHRMAFSGLSAGLLQLLHPAIGAGVAQHSDFFNDPWDRIIRSIPQIMGVIYSPDHEAIGRRVRDYHVPIKGRDDRGRPYSALAPDTYWYAHATFQFAVETVADRFDAHRLTRSEREELYLDGVEWYRRYAVSMRPVPPSRAAFGVEWDRYMTEVLEMNPAASRALDMAVHEKSMDIAFLPAWTRLLQPFVVTPVLRLTAIGGLPAAVRKRFDLPWRIDDEVEYRILQLGIREACRYLPAALRYGPTASDGYKARRRLEAEATRTLGAA
ncbi:MAG TPA: oxygenase MpaB family protein [Acidimicrobiales bacterium]|jgi:uncharacterized protein (DUF2236 family)|nr:oxygenase MpaB family protein [Acidimicrobiales bacterium]